MIIGKRHRHCREKQSEIYQLQSQIQQISTSLNTTTIEKNNQTNQLTNLTQVIAERDSHIEQLNSIMIEKDQQITNLSSQLKQKEDMNQQLNLDNLRLTERNQELIEQAQKLKDKIRSEDNDRNINSDLVAYFPFNNANALDLSGHKNNGKIYGASSVEDRFHNEDNAFYFDGVAFIKGNATRFPKDERTISIWFKPDDIKQVGTLFSYGGDPMLNDSGWEIRIGEQNGISSAEILASKDKKQFSFSGPAKLNAASSQFPWNNLVASTSYNNGTRLYLNGELINSENRVFISDTFVYGKEYFIGKSIVSGQNFQGIIDDIRVYDRELSTKEILQLQKMPKNQINKTQAMQNNVVGFFSPAIKSKQENSASEKLDATFGIGNGM